MKKVIQIITVGMGFFLIFQATAAEASDAAFRMNWRTAGLEKLSTDVVYHDDTATTKEASEVRIGWTAEFKKVGCKLLSQVALDDINKVQATNKVRAVASLEWYF